MSDFIFINFLEVPRRNKWRKRCQRKFRRRRYRTWTCYRPPFRKTHGGAGRRSERERERKTISVFCCVKKKKMRERVVWVTVISGKGKKRLRKVGRLSLSPLLQLIHFFFFLNLSSSSAFIYSFVFLPTCVKLLFPCFLFFLGGVAFCLLLFLNFFLLIY